MGCGCKKKQLVPPQPEPPKSAPLPPPPAPTTAPKAHVVIREGRPVLSYQQPQKEVNRIVDKLRAIRNRRLT